MPELCKPLEMQFDDVMRLEQYIRFRRNVIVNNDLPEEKLPTMDLSQFGQHYGLPSPLLDWTWSPYVALFFALSEETLAAKENVRCIWVIDTLFPDIFGSIRDAKEYTYRSFLNPRHKEISFYSPSNQETQDTDEM